MDFETFCTTVKEIIESNVDDKTEVTINDVTKNNGLVLKGIVIRKTDSRISPTVYLERFYEQYREGTSLYDLADQIMEYSMLNAKTDIDADCYTDFELVKDRIIYKIVNFKLNESLLCHVPYIKWNDLAIVFCCLMGETGDGCATILIRNEHMDMWDVGTEELYMRACSNTPRLMSDELDTMENIINEMMRKNHIEISDGDGDGPVFGTLEMYVLSNSCRIFGATSILYSESIKQLAMRHGRGLYILPSSIHEVIILPEDEACDIHYMQSMIKEINETQVDLEDRLSDNLYYYDPQTEKITIAV
ncbi:MAG: DUF5688 family protein [Lachnospiraceae bacterium]|nr:DUF5688 family protein [Lachnospiraceae bacterium]